MDLSARLCFTVKGNMAKRMRMVKATMVKPKLLKRTAYSSTRLLIIGSMIKVVHIVPMRSSMRSHPRGSRPWPCKPTSRRGRPIG